MRQKELFLVTGVVEVVTGLTLLVLPAIVLAALLGIQAATVETQFVGRIAGAPVRRSAGQSLAALRAGGEDRGAL